MEYHDNHTSTWYSCVLDTVHDSGKVIEQIKEKLLLSDQDLHTNEWLMMISMKNFKI
ncbi:hypothetical protein MTR_6g045437 [Medicago truncatula]|uniref:Uncharacterized protein n=1 Tax=Medicago truncatula TaxID=3880 RepID=A0A072UAL3_MEDTR|nr:hypothetical protein MTR_6g045437 [Medicago truncatula]